MNKDLEKISKEQNRIMNCDVKDKTGLNDFQKLPSKNGIKIPKVGIERYRFPITMKHRDGSVMTHDAIGSMFVFLAADKTGVNMSRFCAILQDEAADNFGPALVAKTLKRFRYDLRDYDHEDPIPESFLKVDFRFPVKQKSLKSENWGWQYYDAAIEGRQDKNGENQLWVTLGYEYSSTCPCSLSMAKQYEEDFRQGRTSEGNGIATAHSQRSLATVNFQVKEDAVFHLEDLVEFLREAIPTETQSLVKREDEQAFAILNGENPMFVEHVSRRLSAVLSKVDFVLDWNARIEHFESLHSHNAVAYIQKEK